MPDATPDVAFAGPDLTTFARLDELGLEVTGQHLAPDRAVLACRVVEPDQWCRRCGCLGVARDTVTRRLAHEPLGWRPTMLLVTVRRYRCTGCPHVNHRRFRPLARLGHGRLPCALSVRRVARIGWSGSKLGIHRLTDLSFRPRNKPA